MPDTVDSGSTRQTQGQRGRFSRRTLWRWAALAAFVGLKGIQYVAKVATFLPLIPLAILLLIFLKWWHSNNERLLLL